MGLIEPTRALLSTVANCLGASAIDPEAVLSARLHPGEPGTTRLLVMLPGAGERIGTFAEHGFVDLAQAGPSGAPDVLEVDAHFGYYRHRTLVPRMLEDVLAEYGPRYEQVWLMGISLGGLGALLTAQARPQAVHGVIALAPYLGRRRLIREIDEAGGLLSWRPRASEATARWDVSLWAKLARELRNGRGSAHDLHLLYGEADFGAAGHGLLARALPQHQVARVPGGHDWDTWTRLWTELLQRGQPWADRSLGHSLG